jgi:hypothetical protein
LDRFSELAKNGAETDASPAKAGATLVDVMDRFWKPLLP